MDGVPGDEDIKKDVVLRMNGSGFMLLSYHELCAQDRSTIETRFFGRQMVLFPYCSHA